MDNTMITELKEALIEITDVLYKDNVAQGIAMMSNVIPSLVTLSEQMDVDEQKKITSDFLLPAVEAMEGKDGMLLADLISYELMPIIEARGV